MPTQCSAEQFGFGTAEGRAVVAAFDGGRVTSDAGALLLGATDRALRSGEAVCRVLSGSPLSRPPRTPDRDAGRLLPAHLRDCAGL